jgi:hypothetical protein
MGACISLAGPPSPISIQLPGFTMPSPPDLSFGIPNLMAPFQGLFTVATPALGTLKPVFDILGFIMCLMDLLMALMSIVGALLTFMGMVGNPLSLLFPLPNMKDGAGEEISPAIPDPTAAIAAILDALLCLICKGLQLAGLIPQISGVFTVKDVLVTAMQFGDAVMAQVNSLTDIFSKLPPANTGNLAIDILLQCAQDNAGVQIEAKLSPLAGLAPLMGLVSIIAELAARPLPRAIVTMARMMAMPTPTGFGLIPFPNTQMRDDFLNLLEDMASTGLPIQIPDFSDMSDIGAVIQGMRESLAPLLPTIELLQSVVDKLTKC